MAYEKECDETLRYLSKLFEGVRIGAPLELTQDELFHYLAEQKSLITLGYDEFTVVLTILASNKHIIASKGKKWSIYDDGIVFIHTNSYEMRKAAWDIEFKLKQQQASLNAVELYLKKKTYGLAIVSIVISMCALLKDCGKATKEHTQNETNYNRPAYKESHINNPIITN